MISPQGAALLTRIEELETECERRAAAACESAFAIDGARRAIKAGAPADNILAALDFAYTVFDPGDPMYERLPRCPVCKGQPDHDSLYEPDNPCTACHGTGADTRPTLLELATQLRDRCAEHFAACNEHPGGPRKNHPHLAELWRTCNDYMNSNTPTPANRNIIAAIEARALDAIPF